MYLFTGRGVFLEQRKWASLKGGVEPLPLCERLRVPLYTLGRTALEPTVSMGGRVQKDTPLALSRSKGHGIMAPASGRFLGVEIITHPSLGKVPCALLQTENKKEEARPRKSGKAADGWTALIRAAKEAGITDEYDGQPLYRKLREFRENPPQSLVINALDDDPYVTSGMASLRQWGDEAVDGARAIARRISGCEVRVAVFDPRERGVRRLLPTHIGEIQVLRIAGKYPVMPAVRRKLGEKAAFIGVQALIGLSRAINNGQSQSEIVVTMAGDALPIWKNVLVPVGTPVSHLLRECGAGEELRWLVVGGTMEGYGITDPELPLVPGIRCVLALKSRPWAKRHACIGCGRCMLACPQRLMPYYIAKLCEQKEFEEALQYGAENCSGCGACTAACPSGIELTAIMRAVVKKKTRAEWSDDDDN